MAKENLTIGKKDYEVEICELNQSDLKFYTENPRVYSVLNIGEEEPSQIEIEEHMCNLDHVKQLRLSIESNGGLIDPLIVRDGDFTVLEGNSRLAAYRLLCRTDAIKWGKVKCKVLPADISDDAIFALLGQYHIIGRKDWDPFEQANYLFRRHQQTRLPIEYMAQELGISKQKAKKMIDVIKFMIENDDLNKRHWSHYEEYLKNSGIKKYRETNPNIDETIVKAIKTDTIKEASDMRKLGDISKVGDKQTKKIMQKISDGEIDLYKGYELVQDAGKLEDVVKKLKTFKQYINDDTFEKQIKGSEEIYNQAQYEIKKIIKRLQNLNK
ncbi:hypothetical protein HMPREF0979_01250 [Coprobacillus sp. 8_1_38FAA]|nr:hypothetical protein HMPREF0979_01250 [Coprobacillus sp. 8_1_38FAA]